MSEVPDRREQGRQVRAWWMSLQRLDANGKPNPDSDPGALALLRRAATPADAWRSPQTARLFGLLFGLDQPLKEREADAVGVLAATLAHVRKEAIGKAATQSLAQILGAEKSKGSKQPLMSELRMRRLCAARDPLDVMRSFREAVLLLEATVNVADLSESVLDWMDERRGERRRVRWLFDYHGAGIGAPESDQPLAEAT